MTSGRSASVVANVRSLARRVPLLASVGAVGHLLCVCGGVRRIRDIGEVRLQRERLGVEPQILKTRYTGRMGAGVLLVADGDRRLGRGLSGRRIDVGVVREDEVEQAAHAV